MQNPSAIRTGTRHKVAAPAREIPWSFMLLVIICACVVAAGFFFAARQHFTSMDYSLKNSKLREQVENLEAEKRRLLLAREVALSPLAMTKAAREIGLRQVTDEIAPVQAAVKPKTEDKRIELTAATQPAAKKTDAPRVVPAVMNVPVQSKTGETRRRVVDSQKDKKEKVEVAALLKFK
jgi:hypothetical protein